jgi:hypothetical protein
MHGSACNRIRYFVPTAICIYLAALCAVLIVTSAFLVSLQNAVAVTASGIFGLLLSGGLGLLFWRAQRRDLQFLRITTSSDAQSNFEAVGRGSRRLAHPGSRSPAQT